MKVKDSCLAELDGRIAKLTEQKLDLEEGIVRAPLYSYKYKYASKKCKNGSVNMAKKHAHYGISFTNR